MKKRFVIITVALIILLAAVVYAEPGPGCCRFADGCIDNTIYTECPNAYVPPYGTHNPALFQEWNAYAGWGTSCNDNPWCRRGCCHVDSGAWEEYATRQLCSLAQYTYPNEWKEIGTPINDNFDPECRTGPKCLSNGDWGYEAANENGPCSDENFCTTPDFCLGGYCQGGPTIQLQPISTSCPDGSTASCQPNCDTGTCTPNCLPQFSNTGLIFGIVLAVVVVLVFIRKKK